VEQGARFEGTDQAKQFFAAALESESGRDAQSGGGGGRGRLLAWQHSLQPLMLRFNAFVRASHAWLQGQRLPRNRAYQVCLPLCYAQAAMVVQRAQAAEAEEGLRQELGRLLVVSAARLHVCLLLYTPETSEELEGYFASVTIEADGEGRGRHAQQLARALLRLATNPFSDLHVTEATGGSGPLKWCARLVEAPTAAAATAVTSARTSKSGASEEANLRRARMRSADLCWEHLGTALHMRTRVLAAEAAGLEGCLQAADRAAAHTLLSSLSQMLCQTGGGAQAEGHTAAKPSKHTFDVDLTLASVCSVEEEGSRWTALAADDDAASDCAAANDVALDAPAATDVELWLQRLVSPCVERPSTMPHAFVSPYRRRARRQGRTSVAIGAPCALYASRLERWLTVCQQLGRPSCPPPCVP
jgi:hypothetical protein